MPFVLVIIGTVLIVSGVRNTTAPLFTLAKNDLSGKGSFLYWLLAIAIIGAVGYIPTFRPLSRAFMGLIVVVLFLSNKGFFSQFLSQFSSGTMSSNVVSNGVTSAAAAVTAAGSELGSAGLPGIL